MDIGSTLRASRIAAGFTQREIAELLGVSHTYISDIEAGRRTLGEKHLAALPDTVRKPIAEVMMAEHRQAIERLSV